MSLWISLCSSVVHRPLVQLDYLIFLGLNWLHFLLYFKPYLHYIKFHNFCCILYEIECRSSRHTCKLVSGSRQVRLCAQHSLVLTRQWMQQFVVHLRVHLWLPVALRQHTARQDLCLQHLYDQCTCLGKCPGLAPRITANNNSWQCDSKQLISLAGKTASLCN